MNGAAKTIILSSLLALLTAACGEGGDPQVGGETHWLGTCVTSADCAEQFSCLCALCMLPCDSEEYCSSELTASGELQADDGDAVSCVELDQPAFSEVCALDSAPQPSICLPECDDTADCEDYGDEGANWICVDGICVNDRRVVPPFDCGNSTIDSGEECDGIDLRGASCDSLGFDGGILLCDGDCRLDDSQCSGCGDGTCDPNEDQFGCLADCGAVSIAVSFFHACVVLADGTARCWGRDLSGGPDGPWLDSMVPVPVAELTDAVAISAYQVSTCAVIADGTARCWGMLPHVTGDSERYSSVPSPVSGLTGARSIAIGEDFVCALRSDGTVRCLGWNMFGQLGDASLVLHSETPREVWDLTDAVDIAAGKEHACALREDGTIVCWGRNDGGQLGVAHTIDEQSRYPVPVEGLTTAAVDVAASERGTCAVLDDGSVSCWGWGSSEPVVIPGLTQAVAVSTRDTFHCALLDDGSVWCWGANASGELGDGTTEDSEVPVQVQDLSGATAIEAPCALRDDGSAMCWGFIELLGIGPAPAVVYPDVTDVVDVRTGDFITCVLLADGRVQCWGGNDHTSLEPGPTPTTVAELTDVEVIEPGNNHCCVVLADGTVRCWGWNIAGQLGDGTNTDSLVPVEVSGLDGVASIAVGTAHTCALRDEGTVACWGEGDLGQLGPGASSSSAVPVDVPGLSDTVAISAGGARSCALRSGGIVDCWGGPYAEHVLSTVAGVTDASAITVGEGHACALLGDGTARCWGMDNEGQLGDGDESEEDGEFPVVVSGLSDAADISAGRYHTCALRTDGSAFCWGRNVHGQLGDGQTRNSTVPVRVAALPSAATIAAGVEYTCALLSDGRVACWGNNEYGQLGVVGDTYWQGATPVAPW